MPEQAVPEQPMPEQPDAFHESMREAAQTCLALLTAIVAGLDASADELVDTLAEAPTVAITLLSMDAAYFAHLAASALGVDVQTLLAERGTHLATL